MQTTIRSAKLRLVLILLFVSLFVVFLYTFLHEAGHALLGAAFGQSLIEFSISFWDLSAHVGMSGGELTQSQFACQAIAGAALPFLVWVIFVGLVPRKASFILEALKLISSLAVVNTLLAWIVIPVLYVYGKAPASDDVTHFLRYSQIPPPLLMLLAVFVYICGWAYFLSKTDGLKNEILLFYAIDGEERTTGIHKVIPAMAGIVAFGVILAFLLNHSADETSSNRLVPPPGFAVVAEIDLSRQAYSGEALAEFTLEESAQVGVFVAVRNINTSYFDLRVVGPAGYSSVVLHGEVYRADRDGSLWEETLPPGTYQVVLTSEPSSGTATVFLKAP